MSSGSDNGGAPAPLLTNGTSPPAEYDHERPWERQPCDTPRRWHAFVRYRELPVGERSLRAVHAWLERDDPHGRWNLRSLERWSSEDGWVYRVAARDTWRETEWAKRVDELLNESARERSARHVDLLRNMQELSARACRELLEQARSGGKLRWAPREIARVVKEALTLERLVFGEVTKRVETDVGFDLSRLSFREIEQLRELEAKAGAAD